MGRDSSGAETSRITYNHIVHRFAVFAVRIFVVLLSWQGVALAPISPAYPVE